MNFLNPLLTVHVAVWTPLKGLNRPKSGGVGGKVHVLLDSPLVFGEEKV